MNAAAYPLPGDHFPGTFSAFVADIHDDIEVILDSLRRVLRAALGPVAPRPVETPDKLLKIDEVARRLAISRSRVYEIINDGRLPARRIGRALRVSERALEKWMAGGDDGLSKKGRRPLAR